MLEELYKYKNRFIRSILNRGVREREDADNIFMNSLIILNKEYIEKGKLENDEHARKVLYVIMRNRTWEYYKEKKDQAWYMSLTEAERELSLRPPSYYYHKEYMQNPEQKEKARQYTRNYKQINKDKDWYKEMIKISAKKTRLKEKQEPEKYRKYLERKKRYYEKNKERINSALKEKRLNNR